MSEAGFAFPAALDAHPQAARLRALCADDARPARRDFWRALVLRWARGETPARSRHPARDRDYSSRLPPLGGCCP